MLLKKMGIVLKIYEENVAKEKTGILHEKMGILQKKMG